MGIKNKYIVQLALVLVITLVVLNVNGAKVKRRRGKETSASPVVLSQGFIKLAHKVSSGTVTIKDTRTISIKGFSYDGAGPDAYFWVGKGDPDSKGRKIPNELGSYDVLEGYESADIELLLPSDLTWKDVDYLAVYCVSFKHNFGYVKIPKNLNIPVYQG